MHPVVSTYKLIIVSLLPPYKPIVSPLRGRLEMDD